MIYSDEENMRWWNGLTGQERRDIVDKIREESHSPGYQQLATTVAAKLKLGVTPNKPELVQLRKWAK